MDKAKWLDEIFCLENIQNPVIIGQSMGGYVGQAYSELFPNKLKGFVSIDSAPLQRKICDRNRIVATKKNGAGISILSLEVIVEKRNRGNCHICVRKKTDV